MTRVSYIFVLVSLAIALVTLTCTHATTIDVVNNCQYTVWAAASPGGGQQLNQGQTWTLNPPDGTKMARIWGRTGCTFDANGNGHCTTGDCGGVLNCQAWGTDPMTLAEYTLAQPDNPTDTIDISLVEGFNIPLDFTPTTNGCRGPTCQPDLNPNCPAALKTNGGCNNPCTVFNTVEYCCTPVRGSCGPTNYSQYFKTNCPDAYSYPQDDPSSTFSCPQGTNYKVTFCP
ncbi:hypothetical protein RND81_06G239700 [Saponaria officinalis]|uniref:Thaumatin-like protein n=1 Tax=Saponaria officinalis TaxID=3572 RepID=A0AAW1KA71_SAPOF